MYREVHVLRYLTIVAVALGVLAIPSSAFATHGNTPNCPAPGGKTNTGNLSPVPGTTVTAWVHTSPTVIVKFGACADFNNNKAAGPIRFDGGTVEAAVGEDPATGTADPGAVPNQPDGYVVVDGDNDNTDPSGQSDGYGGVSNWEDGASRTSQADCAPPLGPDNGDPGSSNSGGCVGVDGGPWVYVPGDVPTPVCGNSSGNNWDGSGTHTSGNNNRDGCSIP